MVLPKWCSLTGDELVSTSGALFQSQPAASEGHHSISFKPVLLLQSNLPMQAPPLMHSSIHCQEFPDLKVNLGSSSSFFYYL